VRYKPNNWLVPDSYDVAWTRLDGRDFHTPNVAELYPAGDPAQFDFASHTIVIPLVNPTPSQTPIALADPYRNLLIIQNFSTAQAGTTDVGGNLFINFNQPVNTAVPTGWALQFAAGSNGNPGIGIVLDTRVPVSSIYAAFAGASGATGSAFGAVTLGRTSMSPPFGAGDLAAMASARAGGQRAPQTGPTNPVPVSYSMGRMPPRSGR
jgi:hypothetical protein